MPSIAQYPPSQIFYENSFKGVDTTNNPLGVLLGKEQLMGYALSNRTLISGQNTLEFQQGFDVRVDSQYFVRHYGLFLLNPQWQGQQTGLLRAWEVSMEILVPPAWTIRSNVLFERNGNVVSFTLDPSQAVLQAELIPPHNQRLYKLVKSSLWLLLMVMGVMTAFIAYAAGIFVERTRVPPRSDDVDRCGGVHDYGLDALQTVDQLSRDRSPVESSVLANCASDSVQSLGSSVLRSHIDSACGLLGILTIVEIDFFHEYEVELDVEPVETPSEPQPPVPDMPLEEEIAPPQFTLLSSDPMEEDAESPVSTMDGVSDEVQPEDVRT